MGAREGVAAAVIALAMSAAPAQATVRSGTGTDRAGDTNGGASAQDLVSASAQADDAGRVSIQARLAAAPNDELFVVGLLGTNGAQGCGAPFVLFSGHVGQQVAVYGRDTAQTTADVKPATMTVSGDTVGFQADDPDQLALPFDCAIAATSRTGGTTGADLYDESDAAVPLTAPAAPAPTPTPAAPVPVPAPTTASTPPVAVPKEAKLNVALSGTPSTIKRNRTLKLKLKIANAGSKRSAKLKVSVAKARGLSVGKLKSLKALAPAKSRTVTLKVKLSKRAKVSTTLKVTVRAGKLRESSSVLLRIGKAKRIPTGPKPQREGENSPIVGTYWWRTVSHVDYAWDNRALYFADGGAVYSGFPVGGLPTTCTTPVQSPEDEFDTREGCLPYTFDAKTGAVTIADKTGTLRDGKLTIDGQQYYATQIPPAGARLNFTEHKHVDFSGMCGMFLGCTITQQFLSMSPDGRFILSRSTTTTAGDPGMGPWTAIGSYPPDQHGTYEVLAGGKLQLSYADGTVKVETFAVDTNHDTGVPDPLGEGVLIGADNFYPDPFPEID
jgi:hypothetical protein